MKPTIMILGITGQDGSYLAELLLKDRIPVVGVTRTLGDSLQHSNIAHLLTLDTLNVIESDYTKESISHLLDEIEPGYIVDFSGQSYVSKSWAYAIETLSSQACTTAYILDWLYRTKSKARFLNASSSEMFGDINISYSSTVPTPCQPYNPYGCAKAYSSMLCDAYRNTLGTNSVSAILYPHESPRRGKDFALKRIVNLMYNFHNTGEAFPIGNIDVYRDWSYAPDIILGLKTFLFSEISENLVFCSGKETSVRQCLDYVCKYYGLKLTDVCNVDTNLLRPFDPVRIVGDPSYTSSKLGWNTTHTYSEILDTMIFYQEHHSSSHGFMYEQPFNE